MPRRSATVSTPEIPHADPILEVPVPMPEDDFVSTLKAELARSQVSAAARTGEDFTQRAALNRRLLQDLWEVHNQFEDASVHLTVEPSQTLFATFTEYPHTWMFKESFDFGSVKTLELKDRTQGWLGFTLRFWYYSTPEGKTRFRGIFEWCDGESYHRYTGWMRMMSQAVLYDEPESAANLRDLHRILKDTVVAWYGAHLERTPETFIEHLKQKYPKGASYAKESYRA
ncbi:MAG: hypothetical protein ACREC5_05115 [Thermoplasmata archaeon]